LFDQTSITIDPDAARYNNFFRTILPREGVNLGLVTSCFVGNVYYVMDDFRHVVCHKKFSPSYYVDESSLFYTKYIKSGSGWDKCTRSVGFYLGEAGTIITSFATDATFFNDTRDLGTHIKDCLENDSMAAQCRLGLRLFR
jgi:hypothetical protein